MKAALIALGLTLSTAAFPAQAQESVLPPDARVVRVWDCAVNHLFKGWKIGEGVCHEEGSISAREALDKFLTGNENYRGFEIVGQEMRMVKRGGIIRAKYWTVYDFQLRPKKAE